MWPTNLNFVVHMMVTAKEILLTSSCFLCPRVHSSAYYYYSISSFHLSLPGTYL